MNPDLYGWEQITALTGSMVTSLRYTCMIRLILPQYPTTGYFHYIKTGAEFFGPVPKKAD
jgi:hypothetical protein